MKAERNQKLIRNLIGNRTNWHVIQWVEEVHEKGPVCFSEVAERLFKWAGSPECEFQQLTDVMVWVARVMPDNSHAWTSELFTEYQKVRDGNPAFVHVMLIGLFQIASALAVLPHTSTEDDREFSDQLPKWLSELLVYGKRTELELKYQKALTTSVRSFIQRESGGICFVVEDTMRVFWLTQGEYVWKKKSLSEFVIRQLASTLFDIKYDVKEIVYSLTKYRESRFHPRFDKE